MVSLDRLKERKLFQWAVAYAAAAWLLLQLLDIIAEPFSWPEIVLRTATVLLGVGFLVVLVVAWYHGEKGRQTIGGVELLMLAAILLLAGFAVALVRDGEGGPSPTAAVLESGPPGMPGAGADAPEVEEYSVAVLPFVNMSGDSGQEYFSDGLTEELLTALAQIPELRVAARASSFVFKDENVSVDSIARALRVAKLVEGGVRVSGDSVRITAQLIDARTGFHLWSASFDRLLHDVLAVQGEIARAVAEQLQIELTERPPLVRQQTQDAHAYTFVLQGIATARRGTPASLREAERLYRAAIRRDPRYARAHAQLGDALMQRAYSRQISVEEGYRAARAAAERALALEPGQPEAHTVLARIADVHDWDFVAAEEHFRRAAASDPADAWARGLHAWLLMRLGQDEEALAEAERAVELDPLSAGAYNSLGAIHMFAGRPDRAVDAFTTAIGLAPDSPLLLSNLALALSQAGRQAAAIRAVDRAFRLDPEAQLTIITLGYVYGRAGRRSGAEGALAELRAMPDASPYGIAMVYAGLDDRGRAFRWLEQAVDERDDLVADVGIDPAFGELRDDPRMARVLRRIGL